MPNSLNNDIMDALCTQFKFAIRVQLRTDPRWMGQWRQPTKILRKFYERWLRLIGISMRSSHLLCLSVRLQFVFQRGYAIFLGLWNGGSLPIEIEILSLQTLMETKLKKAEWDRSRFGRLNFVEEKRMNALCHGKCYWKHITQACDKKVKLRTFREGDLVLKTILSFKLDLRGKFRPNYECPYIVTKVLLA